MDNKGISTRRQNVFFNSLLVLGFDVAAMNKEYRIVFDKKMFLQPNHKAMEVVTHFLLQKLNEIHKDRFSIIWPLMDSKDRRQFQKTSFEYLKQIAQESEIKFPLVLNSVFSSLGGAAFFDLYFAFTTHVVQQVNKTFAPMLRRPKFDPKFTKHAIEMLKLTSNASVEKFQALTDSTKFHLETYFIIAKKLYDCVEKLKLSNSKSQSLLEEKIKIAIKNVNNLSENSLEGLTLKNKEYQNKIEVLWRKIEDFLLKEERMWSLISSELDGNAKPILKGSAYSFNLSNNLKSYSEDRYPELQNQLSEEEKRLSIPRFLQLFSIALELYNDSIKRGNFSETGEFQLLKHTAELDKSFKMLQSFCTHLEDSNEESKKHIQTLKKEILNLHDFTENKSNYFEDLPPSPKACLKPNVDFQNRNTPTLSCLSLQDLKLDDNIEKVSAINAFQNLVHEALEKNDNIISSIQTNEMKSTSSLNNVFSDLNRFAKEGIVDQKFLQEATAKGSVSEIPVDFLHEESLNSQTLCDQVSLSFLD